MLDVVSLLVCPNVCAYYVLLFLYIIVNINFIIIYQINITQVIITYSLRQNCCEML